jgi:hypothetical protein
MVNCFKSIDTVKPGFGMLFLEIHHGKQDAIDRFLRDEDSDIEKSSPYFSAIAYAKKTGKKVFAIDDHAGFDDDLIRWAIKRNSIMANHINAAMTSPSAGGIWIGGTSHLASSLLKPTLRELVSVPMQQFTTSGPDFAFGWKDGGLYVLHTDLKGTPQGFLTGSPAVDHIIRTDSKTIEGKTYWDDYDGAIVHPYN